MCAIEQTPTAPHAMPQANPAHAQNERDYRANRPGSNDQCANGKFDWTIYCLTIYSIEAYINPVEPQRRKDAKESGVL
jgi:hypothetical protein